MSIASRITAIEEHIRDVYDTIDYSYDTTDVDKNIINIPQNIFNGYINVLNDNGQSLWNNLTKVSQTDVTEAELENVETAPMKIDLKGNTSQETTTGKNLFSSEMELGMINNTTGEPAASSQGIRTKDFIEVSPNTEYTISNDKDYHILIYEYDENQNFIQYVGNFLNPKTFTTSLTAKYIKVRTATSYGTEVDTTTKYQLEQGSTATSWEKYTGGIPSPNPDYPQEVKVVKGENVVSVSAKNLMPNISTAFPITSTDGELTATLNDDGTIQVVGNKTTPGYSQINLSFSKRINIQAGSYTTGISIKGTAIESGTYRNLQNSFSIQEEYTSASGYIAISGSGEINKKIYPILIAGNVSLNDDIFVPHSKTDYPINLDPNLADLSTFENGYVNGTNGSNVGSSTRGEMMSPYIKVKPNTTYTFAIIKTEGTETSWFGIGYYTTNDTSGFIIRQVSEKAGLNYYTFTTLENTEYIRVSARNLTTATKVQLVEGISTQELPLELCKINTYKDYFHKDSGKWYVHKEIGKVVLDGSENWSLVSGAYIISKSIIPNLNAPFNALTLLTNYFKVKTNATPNIGDFRAGTNYLNFNYDNGVGGVEDFKTWLSTHNVTLYYVLATPTEEEITNTTLIEQLEAISKAKSVKDKTYITQTNDELPFILDVEAIKEYSVE